MLEPQPDPMPENPILKSIEPQLITLPNEYPKTIVEGWLHAAGALAVLDAKRCYWFCRSRTTDLEAHIMQIGKTIDNLIADISPLRSKENC